MGEKSGTRPSNARNILAVQTSVLRRLVPLERRDSDSFKESPLHDRLCCRQLAIFQRADSRGGTNIDQLFRRSVSRLSRESRHRAAWGQRVSLGRGTESVRETEMGMERGGERKMTFWRGLVKNRRAFLGFLPVTFSFSNI